jgi:hypothetical protein
MKNVLISLAMVVLMSACGQGFRVVTGANGTNGTNGSSCSVTAVPASSPAPNGGSLIACTDGTQNLLLNGTNGTNGTNGVNGSNGANGSNGSNGTNGVNGTNGTNGTVVAPIQLCPGAVTYPSNFPEFGFCINNVLYGVYSANGGFLTEIAPGNWSSNGIGNSCNFTVAAGCVVTH